MFPLLYLLFFVIFLGIQSLAQVVALSQEIKGSPATVMDNMSKSDLLNCQHSLTELILTGYAQKVIYRKSTICVIFGYLIGKIPQFKHTQIHQHENTKRWHT